MCIYSNKNNSRTPSKMSTITAQITNIIKTLEDVAEARKALMGINKDLMKKNAGDVPAVVEKKTETPSVPKKGKKAAVKTESDAEPAANGGAGKAETPSAPAKKAGKKAAVKETEPVKEEKKEVAEEAVDETPNDIKFGAKDKHTETLKKGLGDADKAVFESAKKAIKKYVGGMAKADFKAKTPDEHVQDWLKTRETKAEEPVVPTVLELAELLELKDLAETKTVGTYWHPETGRHVTGPPNADEDMDEVDDYIVGENTKRVYNDADEFLGYAGIGKFKDLKA